MCIRDRGSTLTAISEKYAWIMTGLGAAGGMMRFVGFAILLRIMLSNELWGIYFAGFALATIIGYIPELSGSALLLIAFVGVAISLYDFQTCLLYTSLRQFGGVHCNDLSSRHVDRFHVSQSRRDVAPVTGVDMFYKRCV